MIATLRRWMAAMIGGAGNGLLSLASVIGGSGPRQRNTGNEQATKSVVGGSGPRQR